MPLPALPCAVGRASEAAQRVPAISGIHPRAMIPFLPTEPPNQPQRWQQAPALFTGEHHAQSLDMRRKHQRTKGPSRDSTEGRREVKCSLPFQGVGFAEYGNSEKPTNGLLWRADRLPRADTAPCNGALLINHLFSGYQSSLSSVGKSMLAQLHQQN